MGLSARIQKALGAYNQLSNIWKNRNIQTNTKILTILLYESEVWNTTQKHTHRFEVFHQHCLRKIYRIKWFHRISNEEVLGRARINPVERYISANRPETRLPRYLLDWTPAHGKRSRGRPRKTWQKCILEDAALFIGDPNVVLVEVRELARNRKHWREIMRQFLGAGYAND